MKYEKPEIVPLGTVVENVRFVTKHSGNPDCANEPSVAAYEATE